MKTFETAELAELIRDGREHEFYNSRIWRNKAKEIREKLDHDECVVCRSRGRYSRGEIVHHVLHLKDRPDLALDTVDPDTGRRQLITVCKHCHEELHPEALHQWSSAERFETAERWD